MPCKRGRYRCSPGSQVFTISSCSHIPVSALRKGLHIRLAASRCVSCRGACRCVLTFSYLSCLFCSWCAVSFILIISFVSVQTLCPVSPSCMYYTFFSRYCSSLRQRQCPVRHPGQAKAAVVPINVRLRPLRSLPAKTFAAADFLFLGRWLFRRRLFRRRHRFLLGGFYSSAPYRCAVHVRRGDNVNFDLQCDERWGKFDLFNLFFHIRLNC